MGGWIAPRTRASRGDETKVEDPPDTLYTPSFFVSGKRRPGRVGSPGKVNSADRETIFDSDFGDDQHWQEGGLSEKAGEYKQRQQDRSGCRKAKGLS